MRIKGTCALCLTEDQLHDSHIIPSFVYKWLKKTSVTGFMRCTLNMQKRSQDGFKLPMLCTNCEQRFSKWEKYFSSAIFQSLLTHKHKYDGKVEYNQDLLKFCTSVSWRVLTYFLKEGHINGFPSNILTELDNSLKKWKNFILDMDNNLGKYKQYFYNLEGTWEGESLPENWHMYVQRSIDMDVVYIPKKHCLVYVKLPGLLIIGYCASLDSKELSWIRSSRIRSNIGCISKGNFNFPTGLMEFMFIKCERILAYNASISSSQRKRINDDYYKNKSRWEVSKTFEAFERDIKIQGS